MKRIMFCFVPLMIMQPVFSQKVVSGKSEPTRIYIKPDYKRGLPPILYADLNFDDENNNGILEANEKAWITLNISNKGKGSAQDLAVTVTDNIPDPNFIIGKATTIPYLQPDQTIRVTLPLEAGMNIRSAEHKLEINIREYFGYDMDPAYLYVTTMKFREPQLAFSGIEVVDLGEGTAAIKQDGKLQAGEQVKIKISIQNVGQNVSRNTKYGIKCRDQNIFIQNGFGDLGELGIGEVKEFWITVSPNKRVTAAGNLPLFLSLTNEVHRGELIETQLPVMLDQKPPEVVVLNVKPEFDKLEKQLARFEINSERMTANVGNVIDIRQTPPSKMHRPNAIAVVIGVEKYDHFVQAPYAENDATVIQSYFKTVLGIDKVYIYKSKDVTGYFFDNIFDPSYGELQKAISKGNTDLFVFYSGHGIPSKDGTSVFLLPSDGRIEAIERQGYDLNKFYKNLEKLDARSVTVFLDACFSGVSKSSDTYKPENLVAMKGGVVIKPTVEQPWESNPGFTVFTSSDYDQTSLAFDPSETGLFTYYLCAGMQGKADVNGDKKITSGELSRYVIERVKESSVKIRGLQTPQFHGDENMIITEY
ncbi:MAG: caspase family protein [Bacteroidota bacterium]